jgi:inorganic pyrophosphatase
METEQSESGDKLRHDRIVAVAKDSRVHSNLRKPNDLDDNMLKEVQRFFTNYNKERGKGVKVLGVRDADTAGKLIKGSSNKNGKRKHGKSSPAGSCMLDVDSCASPA